jgi:hypothetical protein
LAPLSAARSASSSISTESSHRALSRCATPSVNCPQKRACGVADFSPVSIAMRAWLRAPAGSARRTSNSTRGICSQVRISLSPCVRARCSA